MYKLHFKNSAKKSMNSLPQSVKIKISEKLILLQKDPYQFGSIKLNSNKDNLFRIRIGNYRVIYEIDQGRLIIVIVKVSHRKDVYQRF